MHCLCCSTISRHLSPESAASSALLPKRRKQSSLAFFVSGQAQQLSRFATPELEGLGQRARFSLSSSGRGEADGATQGSTRETHGLSPSGFRGFSLGLAASEPVSGLPVSGWRETGPVAGGGVGDVDPVEVLLLNGHISPVFSKVQSIERESRDVATFGERFRDPFRVKLITQPRSCSLT